MESFSWEPIPSMCGTVLVNESCSREKIIQLLMVIMLVLPAPPLDEKIVWKGDMFIV